MLSCADTTYYSHLSIYYQQENFVAYNILKYITTKKHPQVLTQALFHRLSKAFRSRPLHQIPGFLTNVGGTLARMLQQKRQISMAEESLLLASGIGNPQ